MTQGDLDKIDEKIKIKTQTLEKVKEEQKKIEKNINEKNLKYTGCETELNHIEKKIKNELLRINKLENDTRLLISNIDSMKNQENQFKTELLSIKEKIFDENKNFQNLKKANIEDIENKFENLSSRILKKKEEERKLEFDNKMKLSVLNNLEQQEIDIKVFNAFNFLCFHRLFI